MAFEVIGKNEDFVQIVSASPSRPRPAWKVAERERTGSGKLFT